MKHEQKNKKAEIVHLWSPATCSSYAILLNDNVKFLNW